jgi:hypothetical protein
MRYLFDGHKVKAFTDDGQEMVYCPELDDWEPAQPAQPIPEVRPEVWNDTPVDPALAMDAVRALCKGT